MKDMTAPPATNLKSFQNRLIRAKDAVAQSDLKTAVVLHHDEADGLCSGALTKSTLETLGLQTRLICLDKLYPEVVKEIESGPRRVIAYSDIGSGHVDWLAKWNKTKNLILTLDHHDTTDMGDPLVHNLNPELDGFSGEKDACSSTVAYLFAKTIDEESRTLAPLAIIGSTEIPGEIQGLNKIPVEDGIEAGSVHPSGKGLKLDLGPSSISPSRASTILNVLGSVGYYRQGPSTGISACLNGFDKETIRNAESLEEERKNANQRMLSTIREKGLSQMKNIQWFHAKDNYRGMSGKVVGSFCSYLTHQRFINPVKYLIGMMNVPSDIPEWGTLPSGLVKVSGRAPQPLTKMIETDKRPPLSRTLPEACERAGGFGDGHTVAASGVFPVGAEERFLNAMDEELTSRRG